MELYFAWFNEHLLAVVAIVLTLIFLYNYLMEWDTGIKLTKRYRSSIFEAQSKIFLNATQYLISGNRDLAIREFLNAVDINRETIETYFALGGLFRSNGEIEKAISIHRSLIARGNISENARIRALKELAIDFDKGGFVDMAIETYKDVLKINRDQYKVIQALCRIYEDIGEWDHAYNYRMMLSKVGREDQAETISHILVEKAKGYFGKGEFGQCSEVLDEAFKYAPSVSAKILWLKLCLTNGNMDRAKHLLIELLNEHPMYTSFVFVSLDENFKGDNDLREDYNIRLKLFREFFLSVDDKELLKSPSIILSKLRLLRDSDRNEDAYDLMKSWLEENPGEVSEVLKIEYIKLLIDLNKMSEVVVHTKVLLENRNRSYAKHYCKECGHNSDDIFWRCPQCHEWETIQFRWKV